MKSAALKVVRRRRARWRAIWLPATVLGTLSFLGLYHAIAGVRAADLKRWRDMAATSTLQQLPPLIETDFNIRFLPSFSARTIAFGIPLKQMRAADVENIVSPHGYVFVPEDVHVPYGRSFLDRIETRPRDAIGAIAALSNKLRARHIHLLVVPVPAKASLLPEELDSAYDVSSGPLLNDGHDAWFAALRQAGVDLFDPTPALWNNRNVAPLFFKLDTHWTQFAKIITARAIAPSINHWLDPATTRISPAERSVTIQFVSDSNGPAQTVPDMTIEQMQLLIDGGAAQFGDDAPVLVIGDSYAEQFCSEGAGFSQMLARELKVPVQNAAAFGVPASRMAQQVGASSALLAKKKIVVLLFALRKIQCNDWVLPESAIHRD